MKTLALLILTALATVVLSVTPAPAHAADPCDAVCVQTLRDDLLAEQIENAVLRSDVTALENAAVIDHGTITGLRNELAGAWQTVSAREHDYIHVVTIVERLNLRVTALRARVIALRAELHA
jgi:hypothetical protein